MENILINNNKQLCSIKKILAVLVTTGIFMAPALSFAARPLVTDDAGTVGKGKIQIELGTESSTRKITRDDIEIKETGTELSGTLTYGLTESLDMVIGLPYSWNRIREDDNTVSNANGFSDISLEAKWRFFEKNDYGFAFKPCITLPSGNEEKGFGTGRPIYGLLFIATKKMGVLSFHYNAGYIRKENKIDQRYDIWKTSFASTYEVIQGLNLVGDIGIECNCDSQIQTEPAFGLFGINYAVGKHLTIDAGFKFGLNKQQVDNSIIAGITFVF